MFIRIALLCFPLLIVLAGCCGPAAELVPVSVEKTPVQITGGYSLGRPMLSGLEVYGKSHPCNDDPSVTCYQTTIDQSVVKIGWDENFIVVERHPRAAVFRATPDATNPSWFIIVVKTNAVYENLSYAQFIKRMETLEIPDLELLDAMDVYKQRQ